MLNLDPTLLGLTLGAAIKYAMLSRIGKICREKRLVARISRITVFPVKSMRGIDVQEADCTYTGLATQDFNDRCFMVTDQKYDFVSARKISQLASITARIDRGTLNLNDSTKNHISVAIPSRQAPDQTTVTALVWEEEVEAIDCGDEVAHWLDTVLGKSGLRLLYHSDAMRKRRCDILDTPWHQMSRPQDQVSFQDGFPYMVMSMASINELNRRICKPVSIDNFRPNIIVEACEAYDEDTWDKVFIADTEFFNIKPCHRCIMTTVDPISGRKDSRMEPLKTLKGYRLLPKDGPQFWTDDPTLGINLVAIRPGVIHVGDPIYATRKHYRY